MSDQPLSAACVECGVPVDPESYYCVEYVVRRGRIIAGERSDVALSHFKRLCCACGEKAVGHAPREAK